MAFNKAISYIVYTVYIFRRKIYKIIAYYQLLVGKMKGKTLPTLAMIVGGIGMATGIVKGLTTSYNTMQIEKTTPEVVEIYSLERKMPTLEKKLDKTEKSGDDYLKLQEELDTMQDEYDALLDLPGRILAMEKYRAGMKTSINWIIFTLIAALATGAGLVCSIRRSNA